MTDGHETAPCAACGYARHYVVVEHDDPTMAFTATTATGVKCANCGRVTTFETHE